MAIKKGRTYATILVDQISRKIIDMIPSRDVGDIVNLLIKYPNIELLTRDGSLVYRNATELANKKIIQVGDRFHIIKLLTEAIRTELSNVLPSTIVLDDVNESLINTLKDKYNIALNLINKGSNITSACKTSGINYNTMVKLLKMNENEIINYFQDSQENIKLENIKKRNKKLREAKALFEQGFTVMEISRKMVLDRKTVDKYIKLNYEYNIENTRRVIKSCVDDYHETILEMIIEKHNQKIIYEKIHSLGYKGSYSFVRRYISKIKKNTKLQTKFVCKKRNLLKLVFYSLSENKTKLLRKDLLEIYRQYPIVKHALELVYEFKYILLKSKSAAKLESWLEKSTALNLKELNKFINGINRDKDAIINAIIYKESNGLIESSVNKAKKVKRQMNGRCNFKTWRATTLALQNLF